MVGLTFYHLKWGPQKHGTLLLRILLPTPELYVLYLSLIMPGSTPSCIQQHPRMPKSFLTGPVA